MEQELQDTARFIRNHRSDSVPAAYADCDFGEGFKIDKITLLFHVLDALRLPFQKRFKLFERRFELLIVHVSISNLLYCNPMYKTN